LSLQVERSGEENVVLHAVPPGAVLGGLQQLCHAAAIDDLDEIVQLGQRVLADDAQFLVACHVLVHVLSRVDEVGVGARDGTMSCVLPL
jgi:hypothetical protein